MVNDLVLVKLELARSFLAEAKTIQETKNVLDVAVAAETYAKRQKLGEEAVQYATSIKVEALRLLGTMLKETPRNKGTKLLGGSEKYSGGAKVEPPDEIPTLAEMGLDKKTSKLAQDIASLPDEQYQKVQAGVMAISKVTEAVNMIREKKQTETREERKQKSIPQGKFTLIYADPPWRYDFSQSDSREIENQYPTMEIEDICNLPINALADTDCVLFLWATSPKLREALQVIEAWGFEYKTNMVWVKDKIGMGYYARQKHELLLIATKGTPGTPEPKDRPESAVFASRTKHSRKPQEFYELLEQMYPDATRIELFSRLERAGWEAWGNE